MDIVYRDLGTIDYQQAWDLQEELLKENVDAKIRARAGGISDPLLVPTVNHLLFCEHPHVYTLGKSGDISHVLISEEERRTRGISFFQTNRGGDITYHGPGQIVGYPILDLEKYKTDIGRYLRDLEQVIINSMARWGLDGKRSQGETGVWLDPDLPGRERKICAMGVRCSRWVTMHGFAFNVNADLSYFDHIIPCGIRNKQVTSLEKELGYPLPLEEVKETVRKEFLAIFG
jgi:lipoyl(octanoyl) transferase